MQLLCPACSVGVVEVVRAVNSAICKHRIGAKWIKGGDTALKLVTPFYWRPRSMGGKWNRKFAGFYPLTNNFPVSTIRTQVRKNATTLIWYFVFKFLSRVAQHCTKSAVVQTKCVMICEPLRLQYRRTGLVSGICPTRQALRNNLTRF